MPARTATPARRQPGSLRHVTKKARGREYASWQWRTRRRDGDQHLTFDVELGPKLHGLRTRTLIALGELSAPLLLERWCRWRTNHWKELPAFTGRPVAARGLQRAAWWVEIPRSSEGKVKLRFRSLDTRVDYHYRRAAIVEIEKEASDLWWFFGQDPIEFLALQRWLEGKAEGIVAEVEERLAEARREFKRGDLSQRDFEADERSLLAHLDRWQEILGVVRTRWDQAVADIREALPRTAREGLMARVIGKSERMLDDPKRVNGWAAERETEDRLAWGSHWVD